jgi:hypothetical protein
VKEWKEGAGMARIGSSIANSKRAYEQRLLCPLVLEIGKKFHPFPCNEVFLLLRRIFH